MRSAECGISRPVSRPVERSFRISHSEFRISLMPEDLADVYRNTYPALVRFLYRKVWDQGRAEDLAQEAFARALVHRPENTRGWLFVVAANMARDEARRAAREKRHLTLLKSEPDAVHSSPEEDIDAEPPTRRLLPASDE